MKRIIIPLLAMAILLGACSTINSRINEKGAMFYSLDQATRDRIAHGDIAVGFTTDMVYVALGQPDAKRQRTSADGTTETWIYNPDYNYYNGFSYVGYHRWGGFYGRGMYRMYWGPDFRPAYAPSRDDVRVTFRDGKVITIDQART